MKTFKTIMQLASVSVALASLLTLAGAPASALEQPAYEVVERDGDMEIRRYAPYLVAETVVEAEFDRAGNLGFRILADYIFGNNRSRREIPMTAPVSQSRSEKIAMTAPVQQERRGDAYRVTFMMPSAYTLETLPEPVDPRVQLREVPSRVVAAVTYRGTWSRERYEEHREILEEWVAERGSTVAGETLFARYDPPFKPWFLRRNEVLVPIEAE